MKPSIQILAGKYKHFRLTHSPQGDVRPTSQVLRGCVFDILAHRFWPESLANGPSLHLQGKRVLDLCAGTGAYGFEALSRGAGWVTFVDASTPALRHIAATAQRLPQEPNEPSPTACIALHQAILPRLFLKTQAFDLIFLDPPYGCEASLLPKVLEVLRNGGLVAQDAIVVVEQALSRGVGLEHPQYTALLQRPMRRSVTHFLTPFV